MIKAVQVDGVDIQRVVWDRLMPALNGEAMPEAQPETFPIQFMSILTLAVLMMSPNIHIDDLQRVVLSVNEYLVLQLAEPGQVN